MEKKVSHIDNETFLAKWMEGEITDKELKSLISDADYLAYHKMKRGIGAIEYLESPIKKSFASIQSQIDNKRKSKVIKLKRYWTISIVASILLLFGLFSMFKSSSEVIVTSISEQKIIQLLDGSEVVLNAKSRLQYNEKTWEKNREVNLDGEAFFKVKEGSAFTVKTGNGTVIVLGTQFNVNSSLDFFEVICYEGKVKVNNSTENFVLTQNESFRKINGNPIEQWNTIREEPSWLDGEISFISVPLKYVINDLEKHYHIKFDSKNIDEKMIYTGSFSTHNLDIALTAVFKTMGIEYFKNNEKMYVLSHSK